MRQLPVIDTLGVWQPIPVKGLNKKVFGSGFAYKDNGEVRISTTKLYRYAKNYTIGDDFFSLLLLTKNPKVKEVESFMDEHSEDIVRNDQDLQITDIKFE